MALYEGEKEMFEKWTKFLLIFFFVTLIASIGALIILILW